MVNKAGGNTATVAAAAAPASGSNSSSLSSFIAETFGPPAVTTSSNTDVFGLAAPQEPSFNVGGQEGTTATSAAPFSFNSAVSKPGKSSTDPGPPVSSSASIGGVFSFVAGGGGGSGVFGGGQSEADPQHAGGVFSLGGGGAGEETPRPAIQPSLKRVRISTAAEKVSGSNDEEDCDEPSGQQKKPKSEGQ